MKRSEFSLDFLLDRARSDVAYFEDLLAAALRLAGVAAEAAGGADCEVDRRRQQVAAFCDQGGDAGGDAGAERRRNEFAARLQAEWQEAKRRQRQTEVNLRFAHHRVLLRQRDLAEAVSALKALDRLRADEHRAALRAAEAAEERRLDEFSGLAAACRAAGLHPSMELEG